MKLSTKELIEKLKQITDTNCDIHIFEWEKYVRILSDFITLNDTYDSIQITFKKALEDIALIEHSLEFYKDEHGKDFSMISEERYKRLVDDRAVSEMAIQLKNAYKKVLLVQDHLNAFKKKYQIKYADNDLNLIKDLFKNWDKLEDNT